MCGGNTTQAPQAQALGALNTFRLKVAKVNDYQLKMFSYGGRAYSIYRSASDPNGQAKEEGVHAAVKAVGEKGYLPGNNAKFYLLDVSGLNAGGMQTQSEAFHFNDQFAHHQWIVLGESATTGGSGRGLSGGKKGAKSAKSVTIHEIGHTIHSFRIGMDQFYGGGIPFANRAWPRGPRPEWVTTEVSEYAGGSWREFVAEVFLGLVWGKGFSNRVLDLYAGYGGPPVH